MRYTVTLAVFGVIAIVLGVAVVVPVAERAAASFTRIAAAFPQ